MTVEEYLNHLGRKYRAIQRPSHELRRILSEDYTFDPRLENPIDPKYLIKGSVFESKTNESRKMFLG
jgi:hypothetical protein